MSDRIFQSPEAQNRIEEWYQKFLSHVTVPVEHREVATSIGNSHVLVAGDASKPPLLCVHGALASSAHLARELGPLLERFQIIAPDVPGQSVRGPQVRLPLKDHTCAKWLVEVLDGLGIEKCNVFGVSWGGFIALQTALVASQRIKHLVLFVPAGIVTGPVWAGLTRAALPILLYRLTGSQRQLNRFLKSQFTTWDDEWAHYMRDALRDYVLDFRPPPLAQANDVLGFQVPTLVLAAEKDLSFPGEKLVTRVKEIMPHAQTEVLKDGLHVPPFTDEFRFQLAERVTNFVA